MRYKMRYDFSRNLNMSSAPMVVNANDFFKVFKNPVYRGHTKGGKAVYTLGDMWVTTTKIEPFKFGSGKALVQVKCIAPLVDPYIDPLEEKYETLRYNKRVEEEFLDYADKFFLHR